MEDVDHLAKLETFVKDKGAMITDPPTQMGIALHKQKHEAYLYGQQHGIIPPTHPTQGNIASLAKNAGNPMGLGQSAPQIPPAQGMGGPLDAGTGM